MLRSRITWSFTVCLMVILAVAGNVSADSGVVHTVRSGETLARIASRYGVSTTSLARANGLSNPNFIWPGQRLAIPGAGSTGSSGPAAPAQPAGGVHVVQLGQTLAQIARLYGTSVSALAAANGITNPNRISAGMTLRVPGGSSGPVQGAGETKFIASISSQRCWLYREGVLIGDWACSTGRWAAPTVPGTYAVQSKFRNAYGSAWDFYMPYWLGIYWAGSTENGIHGLPYNPTTGRTTWEGMVGTPITYGCIMLDDVNARLLYETAYIGMPVVVRP